MASPVLFAVDEDPGALADLERELGDRYGRHCRVVCTRSSQEALARLEELAGAGEEVAVVLAGQWLSGMGGDAPLGEARRLHPHARRALVVAWASLGDRATGEAIADAIGRGRTDHYVLRPAPAPAEFFHQAISSFPLEWAQARRVSPHTVHVVGESWSGRAYELREVLGRCALAHSFCLADSGEGQALVARAEPGARFPLVILPDGTVLADPSSRDGARRAVGGRAGADRVRPRDRRRGSGRPVGRDLRRLGGVQHPGRRRGRAGGPGHLQLADPELPRLPARPKRGALARQAHQQAWAFGASFAFMQRVTDLGREGDRCSCASPRAATCGPARSCSRRAPATGGSTCRSSRR